MREHVRERDHVAEGKMLRGVRQSEVCTGGARFFIRGRMRVSGVMDGSGMGMRLGAMEVGWKWGVGGMPASVARHSTGHLGALPALAPAHAKLT